MPVKALKSPVGTSGVTNVAVTPTKIQQANALTQNTAMLQVKINCNNKIKC